MISHKFQSRARLCFQVFVDFGDAKNLYLLCMRWRDPSPGNDSWRFGKRERWKESLRAEWSGAVLKPSREQSASQLPTPLTRWSLQNTRRNKFCRSEQGTVDTLGRTWLELVRLRRKFVSYQAR